MTAKVSPDYERAFRVLDRAATATRLSDFKAATVESLSSEFGWKHVSFFTGPTFRAAFSDAAPLVAGHTAKMLPEYHDRWSSHDMFGTPAALRMLSTTGVASLSELGALGPLPVPAQTYIRHFLKSTWRMEAAAAVRLDLHGLHTGLIGIFAADEHDLGPRELATLRLINRQLSAIARGLPVVSRRHELIALTGRQRDVVRLLAQGYSNQQIAEVFCLAEDSVKKYVSRILSTTGCTSRMELVLLARSCLR